MQMGQGIHSSYIAPIHTGKSFFYIALIVEEIKSKFLSKSWSHTLKLKGSVGQWKGFS